MRSAPEADMNFTAASALDSQSRRNGTPYIMSEGQVKVCYGIFSKISGGNVVVLLDRFFNQISYGNGITSSQSYKGLTDGYSTGSWANLSDTTTAIATSNLGAGSNYPNHNKAIGEFGLSSFDLYSNGGCLSPAAVSSDKHAISYQFIDSDHKDRSIAYIYNSDSDTLTAIDRVSHFPKLNCSPAINIRSAGGALISNLKHGGMSYNAFRKELIALAVDSGTYVTVKIWSGVDFDLYPGPAEALAAADVTIKTYTISLNSSWVGVAFPKPILANNGSIYFAQQYSTTSLYLYRVIPDRAAGSGGSGIALQTQNLNSVSVTNQWDTPKKMQSRDGSTVFTFSQYYSYGGGFVGWIIDKLKNDVKGVSVPDTTVGGSAVPFGDSGWAFTYGSAGTNGNTSPLSSNLMVYERITSTGVLDVFGSALRPKFPWIYYNNSNTDYPVLFHVADYALLTDQSLS